jgi:hypothetical protein
MEMAEEHDEPKVENAEIPSTPQNEKEDAKCDLDVETKSPLVTANPTKSENESPSPPLDSMPLLVL